MDHDRTQAFLAFWQKLDEQREARGEELAGFEEAWETYRVYLIERESIQRFMEHAAYGDET